MCCFKCNLYRYSLSHVFVFGDLNYRLDPGVVTGRGGALQVESS
jgi:hypothetical protein